MDKAVACAKAAQKKWAAVPVSEKVEIMYRFLDIVDDNKEKHRARPVFYEFRRRYSR